MGERGVGRERAIAWAIVIAIGVALPPYALEEAAAASRRIPATTIVYGTIQSGPSLGTLPRSFWGVDLQNFNPLAAPIVPDFGTSGFHTIRYSDLADQSNITAGLTYTAGASSASTSAYGPEISNFAKLCPASNCTSILGVPGETADPGSVAQTVRAIEKNDSFTPSYWAIGNEPNHWTHYGIAWASWTTGDSSTPTTGQYASFVGNAVAAIRSVDSSTPIIGIEAGGTPVSDESFITALESVDGSSLQALAVHAYPGIGGNHAPTAANLLQPGKLAYARNMVEDAKAGILAGCSTCAPAIFVNEFNVAGAVGNASALFQGYPEVPFAFSNAIGSIEAGATMFTFFDFASADGFELVNSTTTAKSPLYSAYAAILPEFHDSSVANWSVSAPMGNLWSVEGSDANGSSLLVVNANTSTTLTLNTRSFSPASGLTVLTDDPTNGLQTTFENNPATNFTLPPEGILLVDSAYPAGSSGAPSLGGPPHSEAGHCESSCFANASNSSSGGLAWPPYFAVPTSFGPQTAIGIGLVAAGAVGLVIGRRLFALGAIGVGILLLFVVI